MREYAETTTSGFSVMPAVPDLSTYAYQKALPLVPTNEGTLIDAMQNAWRFVADETLRVRLKEAKGIGTPATRAEVIRGLKAQEFLVADGKHIVPTERGLTLHGVLERADPALVDPGVTAQMERLLDDVLVGRQNIMSAIDAVCDQASRIIGRLTAQGASGPIPSTLVTSKAPGRSRRGSFARSPGSSQSKATSRGESKPAPSDDCAVSATAGTGAKRRRSPKPTAVATPIPATVRTPPAPKVGSCEKGRSQDAAAGSQRSKSTSKGVGELSSEETPLCIPFGNKEAAQALGARYRTGGWYAPVNVPLAAFRERGWL